MGSSYDDAFENDGRDLSTELRNTQSAPVLHRDALVDRIGSALLERRSVLLTGPAGVGKTAIIHALATWLPRHDRSLVEFSTARLMQGTVYLGEWQTKLSAVVESAHDADAILYISDLHNIATVGKTSKDPSAMLDALRPRVAAGEAVLIGEATPPILEVMQRTPGFVSLFDVVPVPPLTAEQVRDTLRSLAEHLGLHLLPDGERALGAVTRRFLPQRTPPGPSLQLLRQVGHYAQEKTVVGEPPVLDGAFVEKVFSIYSGLPKFVVSGDEQRAARDIRGWFSERVIGQGRAVEAVVEMIALFKAGLNDPSRPIGSFLFVGPTGVGKTELAKALATYLFGSESRLLRFDMSEFKDYHAFEMLVGDPKKAGSPARLLDPVRTQPFRVVLLDELEKAHKNITDMMLQVLDDGRLTPPSGDAVSFANCIIIATSNAGAEAAARSLGFGSGDAVADRAERTRAQLETQFRPEFLNRFQHVVVFDPLSADQLRLIARRELRTVLAREGISGRNLLVDVDDAVLDWVIDKGVDPRYGARALKREFQRRVVLPLAMTLMERRAEPGALLRVSLGDDRVVVRIVETSESRAAAREKAPVRRPDGTGTVTRDGLLQELHSLRARWIQLATDIDVPFLQTERDRLDGMRREPEFWNHPRPAARTLRDLDRALTVLERYDRLGHTLSDLESETRDALTRDQLREAAAQSTEFTRALDRAHFELVTMGRPGEWDALVELRPLPGAAPRLARDVLYDLYRAWAQHEQFELDVLYEPLEDDDHLWFAVKGPYTYGLLQHERGIHRVRRNDVLSAVGVRVGPWVDGEELVRSTDRRALKTKGQLGGKVRSRLELPDLVLQNGRTLAQNMELATELAGPWRRTPPRPETVVRRYDDHPFKLRDDRLGTIGRPDALAPKNFRALLERRLTEQ